MNVKKALTVLFIFFFMMTAFSPSVFCWTAQKIIIPYAIINPTSGYWTGLAINNESNSLETFNIYAYNEAGTLISSRLCMNVPPI